MTSNCHCWKTITTLHLVKANLLRLKISCKESLTFIPGLIGTVRTSIISNNHNINLLTWSNSLFTDYKLQSILQHFRIINTQNSSLLLSTNSKTRYHSCNQHWKLLRTRKYSWKDSSSCLKRKDSLLDQILIRRILKSIDSTDPLWEWNIKSYTLKIKIKSI